MDQEKFEKLSRSLAKGVDRRSFVRGLTGGLVAAIGLGSGAAMAAKSTAPSAPSKPRTCSGTGGICGGSGKQARLCCSGSTCIDGYCCAGNLTCGTQCCTEPANGSGYCETSTDEFGNVISQTCGYTCDDGFHDDGNGNCVECLDASHCSGESDECKTVACLEGGVCGYDYAADGTPISEQTAGDCQQVVCDGAGGTKSIADDADVPEDADQCNQGSCAAGVPGQTPRDGAPCFDINEAESTCGADGICIVVTPEPPIE